MWRPDCPGRSLVWCVGILGRDGGRGGIMPWAQRLVPTPWSDTASPATGDTVRSTPWNGTVLPATGDRGLFHTLGTAPCSRSPGTGARSTPWELERVPGHRGTPSVLPPTAPCPRSQGTASVPPPWNIALFSGGGYAPASVAPDAPSERSPP